MGHCHAFCNITLRSFHRWKPKTNGKFCDQLLFYFTETIYCRLLVQMASLNSAPLNKMTLMRLTSVLREIIALKTSRTL